MDERKCSLLILDYLRNHSDAIVADLLETCIIRCGWNHNGNPRTYQGHSGDLWFDAALNTLIEGAFIKLQEGVSSSSKSTSYKSEHRPLETRVVITNKLKKTQHILGFSLTEMLENHLSGKRIKVRPLWGYPSKAEIDVFVIMPFSKEFMPIFDDHIKKVCSVLSLTCKRADDIFVSQSIVNDIWNYIYNARIVVCDCTSKNPNVFYELGIAHAIGKDVILLTKCEEDIPFDIRSLRHIKYEYTPRGMIEFEKTLEMFIACSIQSEAESEMSGPSRE